MLRETTRALTPLAQGTEQYFPQLVTAEPGAAGHRGAAAAGAGRLRVCQAEGRRRRPAAHHAARAARPAAGGVALRSRARRRVHRQPDGRRRAVGRLGRVHQVLVAARALDRARAHRRRVRHRCAPRRRRHRARRAHLRPHRRRRRARAPACASTTTRLARSTSSPSEPRLFTASLLDLAAGPVSADHRQAHAGGAVSQHTEMLTVPSRDRRARRTSSSARRPTCALLTQLTDATGGTLNPPRRLADRAHARQRSASSTRSIGCSCRWRCCCSSPIPRCANSIGPAGSAGGARSPAAAGT